MQGKRPSESHVIISRQMLPSDANPVGTVHGGQILHMIDEAAGSCATRHARRLCVTVALDSMTFHSPVRVGDLVTCKASLTWVGRTSMEVGVRVEAEDLLSGRISHTNSAYLVFVAVDENGRATPVPPLILETEDERRRWQEAEERQQHRLAQRARAEARGEDRAPGGGLGGAARG